MTPDVVIIGAGVVGLACAAESAARGRTTLVIERHPSFGQETSSRNSEVIHSGLYYAAGSLKARLCVRANASLYRYCDEQGVWTSRCGKLIVAVGEDEIPKLHELLGRGEANGVEGLRILSAAEARALEPHISCTAALLVPSAGIVDSHELMRSYLRRAKEGGADIAFGTTLVGADSVAGLYRLHLREANGAPTTIECRSVINAAGLGCDRVASMFGIDIAAAGYTIHPNRGHYYRVSPEKSRLVSRLVYPVPPPRMTGIGIHITLDRGGQVKLGPDAEYLGPGAAESEWYRFDETRAARFFEAASRYFPALRPDDLTPDQVGVRPKVQGPGEEPRDFIIAEESARGLPRLVNLIGIESPGLTCAGEIARMVFATG